MGETCSVNVKQLVPDLKEEKDFGPKGPWEHKGPWNQGPPPPPRPWEDKKPWASLKDKPGMGPEKEGWFKHGPRPPFFSPFDIFPLDAEAIFELPTGPSGESLLDVATEEDQPILDALVEEPEVDSIEHLFLAIPHGHVPSLKLEKALMSCMQNGDKTTKVKPTCEDGATKLDCKGADKTNQYCVEKKENKKAGIRYGPICSNGQYATCPSGFQSYKKNPKCLNNEM